MALASRKPGEEPVAVQLPGKPSSGCAAWCLAFGVTFAHAPAAAKLSGVLRNRGIVGRGLQEFLLLLRSHSVCTVCVG